MITEQIIEALKRGPNAQKDIFGPDFQVIAGDGIPLGTHRPIWHTGFEGAGLYENIKDIEEVRSSLVFAINGRCILKALFLAHCEFKES